MLKVLVRKAAELDADETQHATTAYVPAVEVSPAHAAAGG